MLILLQFCCINFHEYLLTACKTEILNLDEIELYCVFANVCIIFCRCYFRYDGCCSLICVHKMIWQWFLFSRACNFRYIAVQWEKPNTYGDALVTGYKVYVNGIVEAILNAEQMSFTFTHGKWCQEYAFQVQALTSFDKLHSKVSEPLVVVWPGCKAPALKRLPTHSSSCIRIAWEDPYLTEGVKVKHFRVSIFRVF